MVLSSSHGIYKAQEGTDASGHPSLLSGTRTWLVCVLFLAAFVNTAAGQGSLLDKTLTIPRQKTTLYEALNVISQNAGCNFIYDSETLESDRKVKLQADNQPLRQVLDLILSNPSLSYRVIGKHILIYRAATDALPAVKPPPALPGVDVMRNVVLRGRVMDNENKQPIPFATVGITEQNIGTITNSDGFFLLKIPDSLSGTSLVVSHLGFLTRNIPVQLLSEQQADLFMERRIISIQEVIIRYIDPNEILQKALDRRNVNYGADPAYLTTFYREGVQKNNRYTSYSEAVFKVYKYPWDANGHSDHVKLLKSRKFRDAGVPDTVFLKLKAGVQSALQLDIVRSLPGFLDQSPPIEYTYAYSNLISYNDRDAYAVTFVQNSDIKEALFTGTVYIEKEGYAILGADFEINPAFLDLAASDLILRKSPKLIVKLKKISYSVSYMPFNGRYYLKHARCDMEITTRLRHHLSGDRFSTFLELATCGIDTAAVVKFPKDEQLKPGVVFADQPYSNDEAFWGNFNTIAPEAKLSEALSRIIGKIERIE